MRRAKGASRKVKSYAAPYSIPSGSGSIKNYEIRRVGEISRRQQNAEVTHRQVKEAAPRHLMDPMNIDDLLDFGNSLPDGIFDGGPPAQTELGSEADWTDDDDDGQEEIVYHYTERPMMKPRDPQIYRKTLEAEQLNWKDQESLLTEAYMAWILDGRLEGNDAGDVDYVTFDCETYSLDTVTQETFIHRQGDYASVALVRAGYIPSAPLIPNKAFSIRLLDFYRILNRHHRRLGLQPFLRALIDFHGHISLSTNALAFSKAYDVYLNILRQVDSKMKWALGRTDSNERLRQSCPACFHVLQDETPLIYNFLCAADGNMSLRRFAKAGTANSSTFESPFFMSWAEVDRFAKVVQARPIKKKKGESEKAGGAGEPNDEDIQDAALETSTHTAPEPVQTTQPSTHDPFGDTFSGLSVDCAERWKANADDDKKVMWDCFEECGVFIVACRHGVVLLATDIVKSGELSKYPLALISKLQELVPGKKLIGYDIGCSFKATARRAIPDLSARFLIPAMHGYAHNRKCQLYHHPKYVDGAGTEDFETCERLFSISNNCASITRYSTSFHRLQLLDLHFQDTNDHQFTSLGKLIYLNYKDALTHISKLGDTFRRLDLQDKVHNGTFNNYLKNEASHLDTLSSEPVLEQAQFKYVEALRKSWAAQEHWEQIAKKEGLTPGGIIATHPLPKHVSEALSEANVALAVTNHLKRMLGITHRWTPDSEQYKEASKWANERRYRLALDRLERLVIQRLFELQKAHLVSTGYKMRVQIAKHLKIRAETIRNAVNTYNRVAKDVVPPKPKVTYSNVLDWVFLSQFDLLRHSREGHDVQQEPWADPVNRVYTDKYFELLRAREELQRLNVEFSRVLTWINEEKKLFTRTIRLLEETKQPHLAGMLRLRWMQVKQRHSCVLSFLYRTAKLPGFTGSFSHQPSVHPEATNPALVASAQNMADEEGLEGESMDQDYAAYESQEEMEEDEEMHINSAVQDQEELSSLVDALGRMTG